MKETKTEKVLEEVWAYDFDLDLFRPYRVLKSKRKRHVMKQVGEVVQEEAGTTGDPSRPLVAKFSDGSQAEIPTMTYGEYTLKLSTRAAESKNELWNGMHVVSKHKLKLVVKLDRHELLILVEQRKQVLQVRCNLWDKLWEAGRGKGAKADGKAENEDVKPFKLKAEKAKDGEVIMASEESREKAKDLMMNISQRFAKGELARSELYEERAKLLKAEGIGVKKAAVAKQIAMKKPAAAPTEDSGTQSSEEPDGKPRSDDEVSSEEDHYDFEEKDTAAAAPVTEAAAAAPKTADRVNGDLDGAKAPAAAKKGKTPHDKKRAAKKTTVKAPPEKKATATTTRVALARSIAFEPIPIGIWFDPLTLPSLDDELDGTEQKATATSSGSD